MSDNNTSGNSVGKRFILKNDNGTDVVMPQSAVITSTDIKNKEQKLNSSVDYNGSAFTIAKHNGVWKVAEIPINSATEQTGKWNWLVDDGTKAGAIGQFKLEVFKAGLMKGEK